MEQSKNEFINNCIKLEKKIQKYKLHANLTPRSAFNNTAANVLRNSDWDIIRGLVYNKYKYKCIICNMEDGEVHAHEFWKYNYKRGIQKLWKIVCLCQLCHYHQHLGYAQIQIREGNLESGIFIEHWLDINKATLEDFKIYVKDVFRLWNLKNLINWKIQLCNGKKFVEANINDFKKCI